LDPGDRDSGWGREAGISEQALLMENLSVHSNGGDAEGKSPQQVLVLAEQILVCCREAGSSAPLLEDTRDRRPWHGHQPGHPSSPASLFIAPGVSYPLPLVPGSGRCGELIKAQPEAA